MKALPFLLAFPALGSPGAVANPPIHAGNWDVKSTAVDLVVPGTPGFVLRMMRGKSKVDHKCIAPEQAKAGLAAVLSPDAKAKCQVESLTVSGDRFEQAVNCPSKDNGTLHIVRSGTFTADSYTARMTMTGQSAKGATRVVIDQLAKRTAQACRA